MRLELHGATLAQVQDTEPEVERGIVLFDDDKVDNFVSDAGKNARYGFDRLTANIG